MRNNFTPETKELFGNMGDHCKDWEDGWNDADSLHHIKKRISNSPYNACPLNNARNHQPEGRTGRLPAIHSEEVEQKYLRKTKKYLDKIGYEPNEKDRQFLKDNLIN